MRVSFIALLSLIACVGGPTDTDGPTTDADGDGFGIDVDCDDEDPSVYPGADELCNEKDDDCNGEVDDTAIDRKQFYPDKDGDGYATDGAFVIACFAPEGHAEEPGDCDDGNPDIYPGATEVCDDVDNDCNDIVDDNPADGDPWYPDRDRDGFGSDADMILACRPVAEHLQVGGDCDDTNDRINPDAQEICDPNTNEVDEDCDGLTNDDDDSTIGQTPWYIDGDGDGYGDRDTPVYLCKRPADRIATGLDCRDDLKNVNPDGTEVCDNGIDDNCDDNAHQCGLVGSQDYTVADVTWEDIQVGGEVGSFILDLPDQNGDGKSDILYSQPRYDGIPTTTKSNVGRIAMAYGPGSSGLITDADALVEGTTKGALMGTTAHVASDVDSDGNTELWVTNGSEVLLIDMLGETSLTIDDGTESSIDWGASLASTRDTTGDGLDEVVIGAPLHSKDGLGTVGIVYLFDGAPSDETTPIDPTNAEGFIEGINPNGGCGSALVASDFDGDGMDAIVIGCPAGGTNAGQVAYFDESPSGGLSVADADGTFDGAAADHRLGSALATGDLNDDGYTDLIVGAPGVGSATTTREGRVYVFEGTVTGAETLSTADREWRGISNYDLFGTSLATGDIDGDGDDEVAVGAIGVESYAGAAYLFQWEDGAAGPITADDAYAAVTGVEPSDFVGKTLDFASDVNGDGYQDLLLGAPGKVYAVSSTGAAFVFYGGPGY